MIHERSDERRDSVRIFVAAIISLGWMIGSGFLGILLLPIVGSPTAKIIVIVSGLGAFFFGLVFLFRDPDQKDSGASELDDLDAFGRIDDGRYRR